MNRIRRRRRSLARLGIIACLATGGWGCGSRAVPPDLPAPPGPAAAPPVAEAAADCELIAGPGEPIGTVALSEPVDPANAPHPSNDSERLLFRQLYETLVRVDCAGHLRPGLAASWRLDVDRRTWIVVLREHARFSDGTLVTAPDVVASWSGDGIGGGLRPPASRHVESVAPVDDRTLAITLYNARADAPAVLAHTSLAIAKRAPGSLWPLGTRAARFAPEQAAHDARGRSVIVITGLATGATSIEPVDEPWSVRFLVDPDRDGRDFLDEGVDLLVTRDRAALDYAATLPQFQAIPLAWLRTHVFLTPSRGRSIGPLAADARQALADEAVRGEARGAKEPFWWQALPDCEIAHSQSPAQGMPARRIVYEQDDQAARDLAERFVGLAGGPSSLTYQRAIGLTGEALVAAQARGTEAGYIISIDRVPLDPCQELRALVDRIGWLDPDTIVPLIDTRMRAITRLGRSGLSAEWDGGLLIAPVGSER